MQASNPCHGITRVFILGLLGLFVVLADAAEENIEAGERLAARKLQKTVDPIMKEAWDYHTAIHRTFEKREFAKLEKISKEIRASDQPRWADGKWKIQTFYFGLNDFDRKASDETWERTERAYQRWIEEMPESVTARIGYADFLTDYAWRARGTGWASTVTEEGWRLMRERLEKAQQILAEAKELPEKDPMWWNVALTVALGQGPPKRVFDNIVDEGLAFNPDFWPIINARAYSLLPRWYGEPGEWEKFVAQAAARPKGVGEEAYARAVLSLFGYYDNIFTDSKTSWSETKKGLLEMRRRYPDSLNILSLTAKMAVYARDRELAKQCFDELDERYEPTAWKSRQSFAHYRNWAETGKW